MELVCKDWREMYLKALRVLDFEPFAKLVNNKIVLHALSRVTPNYIVSISFKDCSKITPAILPNLLQFTNLQTLCLSGCQRMNTGSFKHISELQQLRSLDMSQIIALKAEVIGHLPFLTNLEALYLANCERVHTKTLPSLVTLVNLRTLSLAEISIGDDTVKFLSAFTNLTDLNVAGFERVSATGFTTICKHRTLKRLDLAGWANLVNFGIDRLTILSNLEFLSLATCRITDDKLKSLDLANLTELNLYECRKLTEKGLKKLDIISHLKSLDLSDCKWLTRKGLKMIPHSKQITTLKLSGCTACGDSATEALEGFVNLTYLDVSMWTSISDEGISRISDKLKKLKTLLVRACLGISDASVLHITKNMSALTHLDMSMLPLVTNKAISYLSGLSLLTTLNISNDIYITDVAFKYIGKLKNLTSLSACSCYELSKEGLEKFKQSRCWKGLDYVTFEGCFLITGYIHSSDEDVISD